MRTVHSKHLRFLLAATITFAILTFSSQQICFAIEGDDDDDGVPNISDNCPSDINFNQSDSDGDGWGDVCDFILARIPGTTTAGWGITVNPVTNRIYVGGRAVNEDHVFGDFEIVVVDGATNAVISNVARNDCSGTGTNMILNPLTNRVYKTCGLKLDVLDGETNTISELDTDYSGAIGMALNTVTDRIYFSDGSYNGTILQVVNSTDGSLVANITTDMLADSFGDFSDDCITVNPVTNRIYQPGLLQINLDGIWTPAGKYMTVVDGITNTILTRIAHNFSCELIAVNPATNRIYTANDGLPCNLTVIDGATNTVVNTSVEIPGSQAIGLAVNSSTNRIYILSDLSPGPAVLTVVDGGTNSVLATIPTETYYQGNGEAGIAVNPETNRIYIAGINSDGLPRLTVMVEAANTTPAGSDVLVQPLDPSTGTAPSILTFSNITQQGETTVESSTSGPPPASGFKMGDPAVFYDINTTATFSGTVTLCFTWTEGQFDIENNVQLFHYENGGWQNVTTSLDTNANKVCGQTSSLSPFGLFETSYTFTGFFSPVDNPPVRNEVKAGSAIPTKFSLNGNQGLNIFDPGYPGSQQVQCNTNEPLDEIEEIVLAGESSLTYDSSSDRYKYVWKTNKAWKNTCRQLVLKFKDGSIKTAEFKFK